jgi:hypothetical protein
MIQDIKQLWDQGYTLTQIARYLKTTRNVIAGRMHRAKQSGIQFEPRTAAIIRNKPSAVQSASLDNQITRLRAENCRYILNDDTTKPVYCCEPIDRRSYCKKHADICYMLPEKRRDRRTR